MRFIIEPDMDMQEIWIELVENFRNLKKERLKDQLKNVIKYSEEFKQLVMAHSSYSLVYSSQNFDSDSNFLERFNIEAKELRSVYTEKMAKKESIGRKYYDRILGAAPYGRCPICCHGVADTLDHYAPKEKFPFLCVTPSNLIPSCSRCNYKKRNKIASSEKDEYIHPYFDNFTNSTWLTSKVLEGDILSLDFYVNPEAELNEIQRKRLEEHLRVYELQEHYSVLSSGCIAELKDFLGFYFKMGGADSVRMELTDRLTEKEKFNRNSFESAMFRGLLASDWFCNGGFNHI
jgi:hypothetical protein